MIEKQKMRNILVTGGTGFIGSNLIDALLMNKSNKVTVLDNFDPFYDPKAKRRNIKAHLKNPNYKLLEGDIRYLNLLKSKLDKNYDVIIHLAAKTGVIPSLLEPQLYVDVNVVGTQCVLEFAKESNCKKFIFASSSSVYGVNPNAPWNENDSKLMPISPYAGTKISAELLGHVYSHLYDIQFVALRFFTVYGPRQRPDLAIHKFVKLISEGKPITVFGNGDTMRDYTYIDDIVSGILASIDSLESKYEIINLGNNRPVKLKQLIQIIETALNKKALINKSPERPGDVPLTYADIGKAQSLLNYLPRTSLDDGIKKYIVWLKEKNEKSV
jgi:UDP-glucuronate 4-epimerase